MRKLFLAALLLSSPASALDLELNTPADQTPATMILVAKSLGIWDSVRSQLVTGQFDASGNLWAIYNEGLRYTCTGTFPSIVCSPAGTGWFVHLRYLGPTSGGKVPVVLSSNVTFSGTLAAPVFTWKGTSPAPGSVTITVDNYLHAGWL